MGVFAEWQPEYAARGVATFPVRDKRPAVKSYLRIGAKASEQFALKFANDDAFGIACKRSKIVVLDCDTPDERVFADALDRHGRSPFIVRSGSGNWQAWYRHNGETRRVRPDPALPIDILGDGFVVAPPSKGSKGQYQLVEGSLDDLTELPSMSVSISDPNKKHNTLSLLSPPDISEGITSRIEGKRNNELWRHSMKIARGCRRLEELMEKTMKRNQDFYEPLPADEVLRIVASAWGYETEGKNWFGHGARVIVAHDIVDSLAASDPRAFALLSLLMRHHWGREFYLTKAYAGTIGW
ncbi:MAG: bifunctional DNA primase/polymerase, partial [Brucella intermedia]